MNTPPDFEESRARFECLAYDHYLDRHAAGKTADCDEPPVSPSGLFWRQPNGEYGVLMFNGAWWAWRAALVYVQQQEKP